MAEVAFAAGFGSVRRFNETYLALFGRAPGVLRRLRQPDVSAGPHGEIGLLLRYHPPYDWPAMLEFLRRRAIPGIERITGGRYARSVQLDGVPGKPSEGNALRATVRFPKLSALPAIIARLRRVFDLAADPVAIAAHLANDPALAPLVKARPGLRVRAPGTASSWQSAWCRDNRSRCPPPSVWPGRLVAAHGERLAELDGDLTHVFPRPEALAAADLTSLGMPRSRAAALSAVAAATIADAHLFDATCGLDDAVRRLRSICGVGEWTAQYIALRQLHEPDAFPAADIGLMRAMAIQEGRGHSSSELLLTAPTGGGHGAHMPRNTFGLQPHRRCRIMPRHHHSSIIRGALKECSRACAADGCDQERSLYCLRMAQGNLDKALALIADRTAQADASSGKWCRRSDTCLTEAVMARLDPTINPSMEN